MSPDSRNVSPCMTQRRVPLAVAVRRSTLDRADRPTDARATPRDDDDDEEDDDDAALRARCRRLHAEFAAKVEHLRDHQDLLLEAVRARSETESRRLSQGGD